MEIKDSAKVKEVIIKGDLVRFVYITGKRDNLPITNKRIMIIPRLLE